MNETLRAKLTADLVRDEGVRLKAYKDSVGLWTIGIGHLLGDKPRMTEITLGEAMALFDADLSTAAALATKVFGSLDESRQRAVINMCFNLGGRINGFVKFIAAVEAENWAEAAKQMLDSKWATQVGPRALRLRDMILTGEA